MKYEGSCLGFRAVIALLMLSTGISVAQDATLDIGIARFDDLDGIGLDLQETISAWTNEIFREYEYIDTGTIDRSFDTSESGGIEAVAAGAELGFDLVYFGPFAEQDGAVKLGMISLTCTEGPSEYYMVEYIFKDSQAFGPGELNPGSVPPDRFRVLAGITAAEWLHQNGRHQESVEVISSSLSGVGDVQDTLLVNAYMVLAEASTALGDDRAAIDAYTEAIALFPEEAWLWSARASRHDAVGDYANAIRNFQEALRLDPGNSFYMLQLGAQLKQAGRLEEALEYMNMSIGGEPDNPMAYRDRSRAYYGLGDLEAALSDIDTSLELEPASSQGHAMKGMILWALDDVESAYESFGTAVGLEDDPIVRSWSLMGMGNCLMSMEDWDSAIEYLNATLADNTRMHTAYFCLGRCYYELGRMEEAEACLNEFLSHPVIPDATDPWTRLHMKTEAQEMLDSI
ncbi:MAG: hypothetical protein AVO35_06275 [Candidatus Aegiribacteria sp. MLS_C]|nr:MAG: hypothetical protein AVO35_06275 [Candidatus Aegiribacteria sp. MLS_C]